MHDHRGTRGVPTTPGRGAGLLRLLLVMGLALGLLAPPALAIPSDDAPGEEPPPPEEPAFEPPADGFTWSVPERFRSLGGGRMDWRWMEDLEEYETNYVRPTVWPVDLFGCRTQEDADSPGDTALSYTFRTADGQVRDGRACTARFYFPSEGTYEVRLSVARPDGTLVGTWLQEVVVNDLLVVSLGDSYASGEGNPEHRRTDGREFGDWIDDRCHRSSFAGPAQAARELERSDPHTSVTFLSFACSGATINREYMDPEDADVYDPWKPGSPAKNNGSGVLGPYRGVQPPDPDDYDDKLPSQLDQLRWALGLDHLPAEEIRQVDALVMSAGGNDAGFGLLAAACLPWDDCVHPDLRFSGADGIKVPLKERVAQDLATLPGRYDALAAALDALPNLSIAGTYVTEYPDPGTEVRQDSSQVEECEEILEDIMWLLSMEMNGRQWGSDEWGSELGFARDVFLPSLNAHLRQAAVRHGWSYVGGISEGFLGHGYCVGANDSDDHRRYVRTAAMSAVYQGPNAREKTKGTLHPNERGHLVYRDRILDTVRPQLAQVGPDREVVHRFDTTPPTTAVEVAPAANAAGWHAGPATVTVKAAPGGSNNLSHLEHRVDGRAWQRTDAAAVSVEVAGDGEHVVEHRAVDVIGNLSAVGSTTVRIDAAAPAAPEAALHGERPEGAEWWLGPVSVALTAVDAGPSGVARVEVRQPDGAWTPLAGTTDLVQGDARHTPEYRVLDVAGNTGPVTQMSIPIDATAPEVVCAEADGLWHPADVEVACSAQDPTSGLAEVADAGFALATSVAEGLETADAATSSRTVCDVAGNCATAGPVTGNRVDRAAPSVTITSPVAGTVLLGASVTVDYACADGGSGVASCTGPVPDGGLLETASVGPKAFAVEGVDAVGNRRTRRWPTRCTTDSGASPSWRRRPPSTRSRPARSCRCASTSAATTGWVCWPPAGRRPAW